ncbi:MAG: hypothetical protein H7Z20_06690 [Bdellovibrio sp.]|nr:hypothetical protein [Methylotenera sp.]
MKTITINTISICILMPFFYINQPLAAPEDFSGTFSGTDKGMVTNCTNTSFNGAFNSLWTVTHEVKGNTYTGKGSNGDGNFTVEGEISDNTAKQTIKGVNKWGKSWSGESNLVIEKGELKVNTQGSLPMLGCDFTSEVVAVKK